MIALLQRVTQAKVEVAGQMIAQIGAGLLVLVAVERRDSVAQAERLAERILGYRVFNDAGGKMNLSVAAVQGGLLLVPQFTLAADTRRGQRPSFAPAAEPALGRELFEHLCSTACRAHPSTKSGEFGANMQVSLTNDGPVTFDLRVPPEAQVPQV